MRTRLIWLLAFAGIAGAAGITALAADQGSAFPGALYGVLSGDNEVGADGKKKAGDPDGSGSASASIDDAPNGTATDAPGTAAAETVRLCFGLTAKNIDDPTAAHIHRGNPGKNGGIVVHLTPPDPGDPGASSGCADVDPALANELTHHPNRFYWNVHTTAFPGGAIRGQVFVKKN